MPASSRFTFVSCRLHPALAFDGSGYRGGICWAPLPPGAPDVAYLTPEYRPGFEPCWDIRGVAGWNLVVHAAWLAMGRGLDELEESKSYGFEWDGDYGCWRLGGDSINVPGFDLSTVDPHTPEGRREAICRLLCDATGVDIDTAFPETR